jgi:hypothetical protein
LRRAASGLSRAAASFLSERRDSFMSTRFSVVCLAGTVLLAADMLSPATAKPPDLPAKQADTCEDEPHHYKIDIGIPLLHITA